MRYITIETGTANRVAVMTLNYQKENRFHPDFVAEIMEGLDLIEHDHEIGAIVVTGGDPKFFCNGLDLEWLLAHATDAPACLDYIRNINAMFKRWTLYPKPVVAALNGHTFAGGVFMACHMDFRFMREDRGWVCLPEVDINIPLLPGMIAICQAVMTPQGFHRLYYTGKRATAAEAMAYGFVDWMFPLDQLLPKCIEFASDLAAKRPDTYAEMKHRIRAPIARILDEVDPNFIAETFAFPLGKQSA